MAIKTHKMNTIAAVVAGTAPVFDEFKIIMERKLHNVSDI